MSEAPKTKYRADYQPPAFLIEHVDLAFDIGDAATTVKAVYRVNHNPRASTKQSDWWLDGRDMRLLSIALDGDDLCPRQYEQTDSGLLLLGLPDRFELSLEVAIDPANNTALEGLYRSDSMLCTQCEATGFSRIVYFPDRPDVMARFSTRVTADAARYPVLLANGNPVASGDAGDGRHFAVFDDPFAKPCYLFALVAGDLGCLRDHFTTGSGRVIELALYTEHGSEAQCHHAMASLKQAMAWDEATYGLECDLARYTLVAVGSFNMGAMENKGLNIFNTACVFAAPETATDADFARVRDVVAHEYFHNYTGNRVTCRDWFQLALKEGLTVFREHQFAIDQGSPGAARIEQVRLMRDLQFPEDAGPRAHPVRPESYVEMNNFYTVTVYEKGAELIRMMAEIVGRRAFTRAVRFYLDKHDGCAVTIEAFVTAIEEATGQDLRQFRHWYAYAGTPRVAITPALEHGALTVEMRQSTPATPGQPDKPAFDIPIALAFFDDDGTALGPPRLERLTAARATKRYEAITRAPAVSALRGMSAPVRASLDQSQAALARLAAFETDAVARWDAMQSLFLQALVAAVEARRAGNAPAPPSAAVVDTVAALLDAPPADRALLAEMLTLPSEARIGDALEAIDPLAVASARRDLKTWLGECFSPRWSALAAAHAPVAVYRFDVDEAGRRRVFALALDYVACADTLEIDHYALAVYQGADNMTDRMAALGALFDRAGPEREHALADFAERFAAYPLVMDKWRSLQAAIRRDDAVDQVRALLADPELDATNPNRVRAILGAFARRNAEAFHRVDAAGYCLLADEVLRLDAVNPQIAAALAGLLAPWRRYAEPHAEAMRGQLERIAAGSISDNTGEIVRAGLNG